MPTPNPGPLSRFTRHARPTDKLLIFFRGKWREVVKVEWDRRRGLTNFHMGAEVALVEKPCDSPPAGIE